MGRPPRAAQGGLIYHVLNRANARMQIFDDEADYEAFSATNPRRDWGVSPNRIFPAKCRALPSPNGAKYSSPG